jgi:hypothetical protein
MKRFLKQHGQTAVEYLLVTAVSIGLGVTFFKKASNLLINDQNSFIRGYLTKYQGILNNSTGPNGRKYNKFKLQSRGRR